MTNHLRNFLQNHLDSKGVVVKTGQSIAPISEKSFSHASDVTGVVSGQVAPSNDERHDATA
jgi:hypothetical protein